MGGEMLTQEEFRKALETEIRKIGSQTALAEKLGMSQSRISDYLRGRFQIENMTVGTLFKLFSSAKIELQGEDITAPVEKSLEEQLFSVYRQLTPDQKVKCLTLIIAHFPEKVRGEEK